MTVLKITGEVGEPSEFGNDDLSGFAADEKVDDVGSLGSKRKGGGVYLRALLGRVKPKATARYITFSAPSDDFSASVPLDRVADIGVVIHSREGRPMTAAEGGPFRFVIPNPAACRTDDLDDCANVKFVEEIILSAEKGRDTRPDTPQKHEHMHEDRK